MPEQMQNAKVPSKPIKRSSLILSLDDNSLISNCGDFYYKKKEYDKALDCYLHSITIDTNNAETYYNAAKCYIEQNIMNNGILYLEKAISLSDDNPKYIAELARLYYKKNNIDKSFELFKKLLDVSKDDYWAYSNLGNIYFYHYNDIENAAFCYEKAYEINPQYSWAAYNFANIKMLFKEYEEAYELYKTAHNITKDNDTFKFAFAQCCYKSKKTEEAINIFSDIVSTNPHNIEALILLGKIYLYEKKDTNNAKRIFEQLIQTFPSNADGYYYLAKVYFFDFDKKNAIINIVSALEIEKDNDKYKALKRKIDELKD